MYADNTGGRASMTIRCDRTVFRGRQTPQIGDQQVSDAEFGVPDLHRCPEQRQREGVAEAGAGAA